MLSHKLVNEIRDWGKNIATKHDTFVSIYAQACVETSANAWREGDISTTFQKVQSELKEILLKENLLASSVFYSYCHAARISLLFEVPFTFAQRCGIKHLPAVKEIIDADKSDDAPLKKFENALKAVQDNDKKIPPPTTAIALPIPQPDEEAEQFAYRVAKVLNTYAADEKVKPLAVGGLSPLFGLAAAIVAGHEAQLSAAIKAA